DGNVKVFSLLEIRELHNGDSEIWGAICHVLVDLPPKAILQITGGGASDGTFDNDRSARVILAQEDQQPAREVELKVSFRFSDDAVKVLVGQQTMTTRLLAGNVFVLRIN